MTAVISAASRPRTIPSLSVVQTDPSRRRHEAPALSSPPKPRLPPRSPSTNHLNPTGTSRSGRPSLRARRSIRLLLTIVLPIPAAAGHPFRLLEEVRDGDRQVMVGVQQPGAPGHHAVAVVVGVAGPGDVEATLEPDQPLHGVGRRAVHADPAVPVDGHEAEGGVHLAADHRQRQLGSARRWPPSSGLRRRPGDRRPARSRAPRSGSKSTTEARSLT